MEVLYLYVRYNTIVENRGVIRKHKVYSIGKCLFSFGAEFRDATRVACVIRLDLEYRGRGLYANRIYLRTDRSPAQLQQSRAHSIYHDPSVQKNSCILTRLLCCGRDQKWNWFHVYGTLVGTSCKSCRIHLAR